VEEAIEIKDGNKAPARTTRYEVADVKAIRTQLNVSQAEMAKALGTSVDTIKAGSPGGATRRAWQQKYWRLSRPTRRSFVNWLSTITGPRVAAES
jgi:DNA-binding transcriptional regulator YiaG